MAITDLIPWNRNRALATRRQDVTDPFMMMRRDMDRVFGDFLYDWRWPDRTLNMLDRQMGSFMPEIDVTETDKEFRITADLPGMDEKDIDITLENNQLTVRGERRFENEQKEENFHRIERRYGSFSRSFTLPNTVDTDNVKANYVNGVLKIQLAKRAEAKPKQIKVEVGKAQPTLEAKKEKAAA